MKKQLSGGTVSIALGIAACLAILPGSVCAQEVTFDRAFGYAVDPTNGTVEFENCTTATTCQAGGNSPTFHGAMSTPTDVAVDAGGGIWVAQQVFGRIEHYNVAMDGTVSFDRAIGIDVDPSDGNTGDFENCTTSCQAGTLSGAAGGMTTPVGVALDVSGRLLVAARGLDRINRYTIAMDGTVWFDLAFGINVDPSDGNTGDFESCTDATGCQAGTASGAAGGLNDPARVAVDAEGRILVGDLTNNRVSRFTVAVDGMVSFDRAFGIDVDPSDGDTGDFENCTTATGCRAATASGAAGGMNSLSGIALDADGRILVADTTNDRVDRFTVTVDGTVSFDRAFGIDVDPSDGDTGDFENCTTATGCKAGVASAAAGGMNALVGVAVDGLGRILVTDTNFHRINRYSVAADGTVSFDRAFGINVDPSDGDSGDFELCTTATGCQGGTASTTAGGLFTPRGVTVDALQGILVAEASNHRISRFETLDCGDAIVEDGEGCDDGNTVDGDCCSSLCALDVADTPCNDDGVSCTHDLCDGAGSCERITDDTLCDDSDPCTTDACDDVTDCSNVEEPVDASACLVAPGSKLGITLGVIPAKNKLGWRWTKGDAFNQADVGTPLATTSYRLCVYDTSLSISSLAVGLDIPCSATLWTDKDPKGFVYKDKNGTSDGVTGLSFKTGLATKTAVKLKAKGASLPLPAAAGMTYLAQSPKVVAQLHSSDGTCWHTEFVVANTKKNTATSFSAQTK
jgi:cysteine-rich repeat protein